MSTTPNQEPQTEFRMSKTFSEIYVQILMVMEAIGGVSFWIGDLFGSWEIKLVGDFPSKRVYRGYARLDALGNSSLQFVEFCIIQRWDRKRRKFKTSMRPNETLITFGWSSEVCADSNLKAKSFGCRLFRSLYGLPLDDAKLQPKNWTKQFLWGGCLPNFLKSDEIVTYMLENEIDHYALIDDGVVTLAAME